MTVYGNPPPASSGATRLHASPAEVTAAVFQVVGSLSLVLTLYFHIWTSIEARQQAIVENTFTLLRSWDDSALLAARRFTRELGDRHAQLTPEQIVAEIKDTNKPELRESVNFIEYIAFSIRNGRVNPVLVRRALSTTLTRIHTRFHAWIAECDRESPGYARDVQEHIDTLRQ